MDVPDHCNELLGDLVTPKRIFHDAQHAAVTVELRTRKPLALASLQPLGDDLFAVIPALLEAWTICIAVVSDLR